MIYIAVLLACVAGALGAALVASRSALRTARQSAEAYSAEVQRLGGENATLTATLAARDEATEARLADKDRACDTRKQNCNVDHGFPSCFMMVFSFHSAAAASPAFRPRS